jgi:hypothetical protein
VVLLCRAFLLTAPDSHVHSTEFANGSDEDADEDADADAEENLSGDKAPSDKSADVCDKFTAAVKRLNDPDLYKKAVALRSLTTAQINATTLTNGRKHIRDYVELNFRAYFSTQSFSYSTNSAFRLTWAITES